MRKKIVLAALIASPLLFSSSTHAGTCARNCGLVNLQFVPGQAITVKIKNRTNQTIKIEKVQGAKPVPLNAGQETRIVQVGNVRSTRSIVWEADATPLRAVVKQTNPTTLRVDLVAGSEPPGDRAIYLKSDGHIEVL
jgi:hypothetical protein